MKVENMDYYDFIKLDLQYLIKHNKTCLISKDNIILELDRKSLNLLDSNPVQLHMLTIPDDHPNKVYWCCALVDGSGQKIVIGAGEI